MPDVIQDVFTAVIMCIDDDRYFGRSALGRSKVVFQCQICCLKESLTLGKQFIIIYYFNDLLLTFTEGIRRS